MDTPLPVTVRPATLTDQSPIGRLGAILVELHHEFDPDRFISAGPGTERAYGEFLVSQLARPEVIILIAEEAGRVVGYSYAGIEGNDWMALRGPAGVVYDLVVDPERRREGIGRLLLDAIRSALVEKGAPRVLLSTADRNVPAQALFASAAFRRTMIEMTWDPQRE
jgi:ribosomal protein S18 acetylase RimI-like enzyme